ncbi:MAG: ABC transporter substrate-binding protein [Nitrosomonadales bacterium]|nr:ABC transporter substrate-binding protein [Nitrosomonadales bacterium]
MQAEQAPEHGRVSTRFKPVLLVGGLLVVLAVYGLWGQPTASKPVRIGVLHSLTGTMASSEAKLVDALHLAIEEANAAGGINGRKIEASVVDCRSDAAYCAQQAERLIVEEKVSALFGCWTSVCRKAVKPIVEKHRHLLFYPLQYEGLEQSHDIVYTGAAPNQQLIPMVNWALQNYGKRAYLIGSDYVFPRVAHQTAKKLLLAHDGKLVAERYVPLGERDFSALARDIAAQHPDFVLNTLNGDSNQHFFRALHQAGVRAEDIPVFSTSIAETELAAIGPELVAGHYAAWNYFQSLPGEENRAFVEAFRRRFGQQRVLDDPMEASYIGMRLWVNAQRSAGTLDMATVKMALGQQTLAAPEGIVAVDADTRHLWKPVRIGRARADGQFEIVWESGHGIKPAPVPYFIPYAELKNLTASGSAQ